MTESDNKRTPMENVVKLHGQLATKDLWTSALAKAVVNAMPLVGSFGGALSTLSTSKLSSAERKEKHETMAEEQTALVKELIDSGIDPVAFDVLMSNEMNRRLKLQFGMAFLGLTTLFTAASYSIVILNGVYTWNISEVAITSLIIETPIQFIGLLYIIARNLFPERTAENAGISHLAERPPAPKKSAEPINE